MTTIEEVLTRGVEKILPNKDGLAKLMKERQITLYQGFDPSNPALHIGNFIGIRKLAEFQKLGAKVIFLIGDFTGMIGDPTDKSAARKQLTHDEVLENLKNYKSQAGKILKFDGPNQAEVRFNFDWLSKLTFEEVVQLASHFTVQQMLERDFFQQRLKEKRPIHLHEFLYPLMQGYDSVAMGVDLEIGGSDQLFNMLAGRNLMKNLKGNEKFVLAIKLLTDPNGKKMGKTEGNAIFLTDSPNDIFAKVMAFTDGMMPLALELLTDLPMDLLSEENPLDLKKLVAESVVEQIHGKKDASKAKENFQNTFQNKKPEFSMQIPLKGNLARTISLFTTAGSISEAKRIINQGGIDVNGTVVKDSNYQPNVGDEIKIGKQGFGTVVES